MESSSEPSFAFERIELLHQAHSDSQADIWLVGLKSGEQAVLRDYSGERSAPQRLLCRWALKREVKVHALLEGVPGIPRLIQVLDRDRYLMEWIDGAPLSSFKKDRMTVQFFQSLQSTLTEMHRRGVAHGDLRNKNIMVTPDGRPYVIDFSTAWWGTSFWRKPLFHFMRDIDLRRLAKSKAKFCPESLSDLEKRNLRVIPWYHRFGRLYRHRIYPKIMKRGTHRSSN